MENEHSEQPLVNRVAQSGLITIDLEKYYPKGEIVAFDLKPFLFRELILREKEFREALKEHDWAQYKGKNLAVYCSSDAIIPMWAYMLVSTLAAPYAADIVQCPPEIAIDVLYAKFIATMDISAFADQRLVIKGCGDKTIPPTAYLEITRRLQPIARSIMFGEPCSTVPVYKRG